MRPEILICDEATTAHQPRTDVLSTQGRTNGSFHGAMAARRADLSGTRGLADHAGIYRTFA